MVSEQTINEFQNVIKKELGVVLSTKDASEILLNWVEYFNLLAKINNRDNDQKS